MSSMRDANISCQWERSQHLRRRRVAARALFGFSLVLGGCGDPEEPCQAVLTAMAAPADGQVAYHASATGDARLTAVTYAVPTGDVNVKSPPASFSVDIDVTSGAPITIAAVGATHDGGRIIVSYEFTDAAGGEPIAATTSCGQ